MSWLYLESAGLCLGCIPKWLVWVLDIPKVAGLCLRYTQKLLDCVLCTYYKSLLVWVLDIPLLTVNICELVYAKVAVLWILMLLVSVLAIPNSLVVTLWYFYVVCQSFDFSSYRLNSCLYQSYWISLTFILGHFYYVVIITCIFVCNFWLWRVFIYINSNDYLSCWLEYWLYLLLVWVLSVKVIGSPRFQFFTNGYYSFWMFNLLVWVFAIL